MAFSYFYLPFLYIFITHFNAERCFIMYKLPANNPLMLVTPPSSAQRALTFKLTTSYHLWKVKKFLLNLSFTVFFFAMKNPNVNIVDAGARCAWRRTPHKTPNT